MEFAATFEYLILGVADRTSPLHQDAAWPGSSRGEWIWTTSQMISASAYITSSRAANCPMTAPRRSQDARQLAKPAPPVTAQLTRDSDGVSGWGGRAHSVGSIPRPLLRVVERREATATQTDRIAHSLVSVCVLERVPWTLDGVPQRTLPPGVGRARRRVL